MNRKIHQQALESVIRSHLAGVVTPEPASLDRLLNQLPVRTVEDQRVLPRFPIFLRIATLAVVVALVTAAVGLPMLLAKPGMVIPTPPPETTVASPTIGPSEPPATPTPKPTAPPSGSFTRTGSMVTARWWGQTATPLLDGRVLVAGGSRTALSLAELYDPKTGTFTSTQDMITQRCYQTATLLQDGRVLVAGGTTVMTSGSTGELASTELYDPASGTWSATGSMTAAREWGQTATLLLDGRVLIAGGSGSAGIMASAEIYDPRTGQFTATGSMHINRYRHTATLLPDGRVLIAGGYSGEGRSATTVASAELYDPSTGTFSPTGSMTTARDEHTATALAGGRVLIAGGYSGSYGNGSDPSKALSSAELYDPTTGRFSTTGSMTQIRWWGHTATRLLDGRVLITGGWGSNTLNLATADVYNPSTGTFAATDAMTASRYGATATLLSGGRVLIAGGSDGNTVFASAELYQP
jgi:hypothetical protein